VSAAENRRRMELAFAGLAHGDSRAFAALMSEDFSWTVPGDTAWSRTYQGREAVSRELFRNFYALFAETQALDALSFTAQDDRVLVEARGRPVRLKAGGVYANEYVFVCRFRDGQLVSVREYLDTARMLVLDPPPWALLPTAAAQG